MIMTQMGPWNWSVIFSKSAQMRKHPVQFECRLSSTQSNYVMNSVDIVHIIIIWIRSDVKKVTFFCGTNLKTPPPWGFVPLFFQGIFLRLRITQNGKKINRIKILISLLYALLQVILHGPAYCMWTVYSMSYFRAKFKLFSGFFCFLLRFGVLRIELK